MLDLDSKFYEMLEKLELSDSKVQDLRKGRDAIRSKISSAFENVAKPKYRMQGSFAMKTTVQVLKDIEYDLDDGIYLQHLNGKEEYEWDSVYDIHNFIYNAIKDHTNNVVDKAPCVRVTYSKNYHIDLPIYVVKDEIAYLAHLNEGWIVSDPKALRDWFFQKVKENDEKLRDVVKLLKAWKDNLNYEYEKIDLCGLAITILVGENYLHKNSVTDTLLLTITEIVEKLESNCICCKPVMPTSEDLFSSHSLKEKNDIILYLKKLKKNMVEARDSSNEKEACDKLKITFGDRFPSGSELIKNQKFLKTTSPAVLNKDGKSA